MSFKIDDEMISRLVRAKKYDVPLPVEAGLNRHLADWEKHKEKKRRVFGWYPAAAAAAAATLLIIALVFVIRPGLQKERLLQPAKAREVVHTPPAAANKLVISSPPAGALEKNAGETGSAPIDEIRTEFELKDKNIKIIWFQKKDFKLRRTKS